MKYFWITVGNTLYDIKRLGLDVLPYPLLYYSPSTAFKFKKSSIYLSEKHEKVEIGFEIVAKVGSDVYQNRKVDLKKVIESYCLCVGLSTNKYLKEMTDPTDRDIGVCEYYSRWSDNSNLIKDLKCSEWKELHDDKIIVKNSKNKMEIRINYFHNPIEILNYISSFTPIYKNTYICLGHLDRIQFIENESYDITVESLGVKKKVGIVAGL